MPPLEPALLLEHADFVRALARSLIRDPSGADDVEQETWVRALQSGPRDRSSLRGWLATVMKNVVRNRVRSQSRRTQREAAAARSESVAPSSTAAEQSDTLRSVVGAVVALDEPYRSTVLALYFQGLSSDEIARREGVSNATVRSRHLRALAKLRERMDREYGDRSTWCVGLAALTGLEAAAPAGAITVGIAAAALLALVGAAAWWNVTRTPEAPAPIELATAKSERLAEAPAPLPIVAQGLESPPTVARTEAQASAQIVVRGRVERVDDENAPDSAQPAANVQVDVGVGVSRRMFAGPKSSVEVTTDVDGRFELNVDDPADRPLKVSFTVASTDTHRTVSETVEFTDSNERSAEVTLRQVPHGSLSIRVERTDGTPLADELVRMKVDNETADREARTDESGVATFSNTRAYFEFRLVDSSWCVVDYQAPEPREHGGYDLGRIVVAPPGSLRISLRDAFGAPFEGADVSASIAPWETELRGQFDWAAPHDLGPRRGETDASGEVLFPSVWSGVDLCVTVEHGKQRIFARAQTHDGKLIDDEAGERALRVEPGRELALRGSWGGALRISAELVRADGTPITRALVTVLDRGRAIGERNRTLLEAWIEDFERPTQLVASITTLIGPIEVVAVEDRELSKAFQGTPSLGYLGGRSPTASPRAFASVQLPTPSRDADAKPLEARLVLVDTLSITGRLLDRDGAPANHYKGSMGGHRIYVTRPGGSLASADAQIAPTLRTDYVDDDRFEITGLPPGDCDILVTEEIERFYTFSGSVQRFAGIAAGAQGVELRLRDPGEVRVKLRTDADPERASSMIVLMAALTPSELDFVRASAPQQQRVRGLAPWPRSAPIDFAGIGGGRDELGRWSFGCDPVRSAARAELPTLAPGWYVFGVRPSVRDGFGYAPSATRLAYYEAGEYEIDFELRQTCDVAGIVRRRPDQLAAVELLDTMGERVCFVEPEQRSTSATRALVPSSGRVVLPHTPFGNYRLRAGSPEQLDRGEFARELEITVDGSFSPFEIDLR